MLLPNKVLERVHRMALNADLFGNKG
jgi:hypothetical protein